MKVATGLTIGKKASADLAAKAVLCAMQKAGISAPACVLLFLTSEFAADPQSAIKAAAKAASCTNIIGCSATGIFTDEDWVIDSPAAAAMVFSENIFVDFKSAQYGQKNHDGAKSQDYLLTLTAPNAIDTRWLNANNSKRFGGVSGDAIGQGPFSVWQNAKGTSQGYCEFAFNNLHSAVAASHGLKLISSPRRISACQNHDVINIANQSALNTLELAWLKHASATQIAIESQLPYHQLMAVYANKAAQIERGDYNVATLITGNEENASVTLAKPMQTGDWLSWAIRDTDAAQIDIVKTASTLRRQFDLVPQFCLLFSCLGRGPYFYNGLDQDLALLKTLLPKLPIIGFYGNGEIAPIHGKNELLQYSAVLGLFSYKELT